MTHIVLHTWYTYVVSEMLSKFKMNVTRKSIVLNSLYSSLSNFLHDQSNVNKVLKLFLYGVSWFLCDIFASLHFCFCLVLPMYPVGVEKHATYIYPMFPSSVNCSLSYLSMRDTATAFGTTTIAIMIPSLWGEGINENWYNHVRMGYSQICGVRRIEKVGSVHGMHVHVHVCDARYCSTQYLYFCIDEYCIATSWSLVQLHTRKIIIKTKPMEHILQMLHVQSSWKSSNRKII